MDKNICSEKVCLCMRTLGLKNSFLRLATTFLAFKVAHAMGLLLYIVCFIGGTSIFLCTFHTIFLLFRR